MNTPSPSSNCPTPSHKCTCSKLVWLESEVQRLQNQLLSARITRQMMETALKEGI
jgi:hypothetical protein